MTFGATAIFYLRITAGMTLKIRNRYWSNKLSFICKSYLRQKNEGLFVKIGQAVQKIWTFENWKNKN